MKKLILFLLAVAASLILAQAQGGELGDDKQDLHKEFMQMVKEYKMSDGLAKN